MIRLRNSLRTSLFIRPNFSLASYSFSTTRFLKSDEVDVNVKKFTKLTKKKYQGPKTLEELLKVPENNESSINTSNESADPTKAKKKVSQKPIDVITTGPKIPDNWRKLEKLPEWKRQKFSLIQKFNGEKWDPKKKLSREDMKSVKLLKQTLPELTASDLAEHFKISPEAIRRILKSKWSPTLEEDEDIYERWKKRGERIKAELYAKEKKIDQDEISIPKVIIRSGTEYNAVRNIKYGSRNTTDTKKQNKTINLRKMRF